MGDVRCLNYIPYEPKPNSIHNNNNNNNIYNNNINNNINNIVRILINNDNSSDVITTATDTTFDYDLRNDIINDDELNDTNDNTVQCVCKQRIIKDINAIQKHRNNCSYHFYCCIGQQNCFEIFQTKSELEYHQYIEHGCDKSKRNNNMDNKTYKCIFNGCNKVYYCQRKLSQHMKTHTKPYKCNHCIKQFATKSEKKYHERIHNDTIKYEVCPYCDKTFNHPSNLKKHIQYIHANIEKQFICKDCNKAFKRKDSLTKHMETHKIKRNVFECKICKQKFTYKSNMLRHQRKYHNNCH